MTRSTLGVDFPEPELSKGPTRQSEPATKAPSTAAANAGAKADHSTVRRAGRPGTGRRTVVLGTLFAAGAVLLALAVTTLGGSGGGGADVFVYYTVKRSDLPITVTERGNLESQDSVVIRCEVDDIEGDGLRGTPILSIVRNGTSVKKDDLLVELDVSNHRERLDRQVLNTEKARSEQIQAEVKYENQKTQNETTRAEAELKVELAKLAVKQYEDEDGGTFQLDLQDIELLIQEAQAGKLIEETNLTGVEELYQLGYRSSGELAQARLSALKAERQLATSISKKRELVQYQYRKTKLELEGALKSAERALLQAERDNIALLKQARAAMDAADEGLKKEEERLARYEQEVANAKIYAPQDGMVAYAVSDHHYYRADIRPGAAVRPRQRLLSLPNLTKMQVKTSIHESVLDQVHAGLKATIRADAVPDRSYAASVHSVAVLPDQNSSMSSDTKVYETIVTIDEDVEHLKPGMSAVVEIHVDRRRDVLSVPVQAVVQIEDETWCYVRSTRGVERHLVRLGRSNDKFVEIRDGLTEGVEVVLNPTAVVDESSEREQSFISPDGES